MSKFIAVLALLSLSAIVGYISMTCAWGVQIKSWGWFFGTFFAHMIIIALLQTVQADKD